MVLFFPAVDAGKGCEGVAGFKVFKAAGCNTAGSSVFFWNTVGASRVFLPRGLFPTDRLHPTKPAISPQWCSDNIPTTHNPSSSSAHTVQRKPEVNPQTGIRPVQKTSERGLAFRTDKVSEVHMNQKSNKSTDKGFNRCFPKDDDSSESPRQRGDLTSQS